MTHSKPPLQYELDSGKLTISQSAFDALLNHQQWERNAPERGGLLFARFDGEEIEVAHISGPSSEDKGSRHRFTISTRMRKRLVKSMFKKGLHYIGEWHTHPETDPYPSSLDLKSMEDLFQRSKHELDSFLMLIVGNDLEKPIFWLSLHDGNTFQKLKLQD